MNKMRICRTLFQPKTEHAVSSSAHGTVFKVEHTVDHSKSLNCFWNIAITQRSYNEMKLKINSRSKTRKLQICGN